MAQLRCKMRRNVVTMKKNELYVVRGARVILRRCRLFCLVSCVLTVLMGSYATLAQTSDAAVDPLAIVRRASQNELRDRKSVV